MNTENFFTLKQVQINAFKGRTRVQSAVLDITAEHSEAVVVDGATGVDQPVVAVGDVTAAVCFFRLDT